ncbi:unnamed protein product, partial [Timema podura]|nr:unnamed protein product [Timema podura]
MAGGWGATLEGKIAKAAGQRLPWMEELLRQTARGATSEVRLYLADEIKISSKVKTVNGAGCTLIEVGCLKLVKFDRLSPDYVAAEIVKGILEERETMTVPRFMEFWICLLR